MKFALDVWYEAWERSRKEEEGPRVADPGGTVRVPRVVAREGPVDRSGGAKRRDTRRTVPSCQTS